jgi:hypothetical protein
MPYRARWQGSASNDVRIGDLSEGGCYVDTIAQVVGKNLFLSILLPDGEWFQVQGVVAHHSPRLGFGLRFVNLVKSNNTKSGRFLEYRIRVRPSRLKHPTVAKTQPSRSGAISARVALWG